jgi:thiosulfate/3-mercaptopyruvate sulfurtransferase
VIVDCRHELARPQAGRAAFDEGHIRGAQFLHLDDDLSGLRTGHNGRHPLPDPAVLAHRLEAIGIGNATQVVVYDAQGGMMASRLWWLLRWLGHDAVAVLDGGLPQWQSRGLPLTRETMVPTRGHLVVHLRDWVVDAASVQANIASSQNPVVRAGVPFTLIDARAADRYRGENETLDPVAGHVPGARNHPFSGNLDATGCFRPAHELRQHWQATLGASPASQVVHMCGSGVSACHNLLALEVAGLSGGRLYAGSWSEWCSDPGRPAAKGDQVA